MNQQFGRKRSGGLKYLEDEELSKFMHEAAKKPKYDCLFALVLSYGLRESEAISIRLSDIRENHTIFIRAKKNGWDREYEISDTLWRKIQKYLRSRTVESPWLFPHYRNANKPASSSLVIIGFKSIAERISLTGHSPHSLRHTCGVQLARQGMNAPMISRHLRHKCIASSWQYTQFVEDREHDKKVLGAFEPFLR